MALNVLYAVKNTPVPWEHPVAVGAGVAALVSVLLGLIATGSAYRKEWRKKRKKKPKVSAAWTLGFAALIFASVGTVGGLWALAGKTGWVFLTSAIIIFAVVASVILWGKWFTHFISKSWK
jgi:hypothetical protein